MSCGKQRKKFSFCEQRKMDWNVILSAVNDVFSIIGDPSLIYINMLLLELGSAHSCQIARY